MRFVSLVRMGGLPCAATLILCLPVRVFALAIAITPIPDRVVSADCVVVGKVTAIENQTVKAKYVPGAKEPSEFRIALIKVEEGIKGVKGKEVRVGFLAPAQEKPAVPNKPDVIRRIRPPNPIVTVGQEGCFFLNKHFADEFYLANLSMVNLYKTSPNYDKDLSLVKRCAKVLDQPMSGLQAKEADERLLAAHLLVTKYRGIWGFGGQKFRTEPIDAGESKLILEVLAAADWTRPANTGDQPSPMLTFQKLGLTAKEGWTPPMFNRENQKEHQKLLADAARKWLKDNAGTYRIQRVILEKPVAQ